MNNNENHINQIDSFLLGEMSEKLKIIFLEAMQNDKELREEVSLRRDIMNGIRIDGRKKLKQTLDEIHYRKDRTIHESNSGRTRKLVQWLAAACLIFLLCFKFLWNPMPKPNLFSEYYQPYELSLSLRNLENTEDLTTIDKLYTDRKYATAQPIIESYLKENPNQKTLQLALAICQFENSEFEEAINSLQVLEDDPFLKDQAKWYSALINLSQKNKSEAIRKLESIVSDIQADHYNEAKKLLNEIRKTQSES